MRAIAAGSLLISTLLLGACVNQEVDPSDVSDKQGDEQLAAANPAAVHCREQGYELVRAGTDVGGNTLMCVDVASGQKCPVWKFFRQECALPEHQG